jgi:hypothetical protein
LGGRRGGKRKEGKGELGIGKGKRK